MAHTNETDATEEAKRAAGSVGQVEADRRFKDKEDAPDAGPREFGSAGRAEAARRFGGASR